MVFKTPKQVEEKLEEILSSILENKGLLHFLEGCKSYEEKWVALEKHVINHLADYGLEPIDWGLGYEDSLPGDSVPVGFLRDRFFYEMQQKTKMDFGFCPYFIPAYKERAKYLLEGQKEDPEKNWDKCTIDGEEISTTCNGTRDICVLFKRIRTSDG